MLTLTWTPRTDGTTTFTATRADGSSTWQRHEGPQAAFFPLHDLTHYAVETVLGTRDGFFGLIADGWDIADTGGKGARGALPAEAVLVEQIVGLLDRERVGGAAPMTARDIEVQLSVLLASGRIPAIPMLDDGRLGVVRVEAERVKDAWAASAAAGQPFVLTYTRPPATRLTMRSSAPRAGAPRT